MKVNGIVAKYKFIPQWVFTNELYKRACVRGLMDTEGCIAIKKYQSRKGGMIYKQLTFRNLDNAFMRLVRDVLLDLGLSPTMTLKKSLHLSNDRSLAVYSQRIGFKNPQLQNKSSIKQLAYAIKIDDSTNTDVA